MTPYLNIKDVYKTPSFRGLVWSRNMEGTQPVSTLNPGELVYLVVLTQNILPDQQFEITYPLMDGVSAADFELGVYDGSMITRINHYDPETGYGREVIKVMLKS